MTAEAEHNSPDAGAPRVRFERLALAVKDLSAARSHDEIVEIARHAAREIVGAMGVAIVLRDGEHCHYIAEDSAVPLWSGQKFPLGECVSGWAMLNREQAVIADIYADPRVPHEAYRPTGIHSLVMTPVGEPEPFGALGVYWREVRQPTTDEVSALAALASCMATALQNIDLVQSLRFQARLLDAVGEAVIATDQEGKVTFWNRAAEQMYGWSSAETLGVPIIEITPTVDSKAESDAILARLQQGHGWSGELRLRRRDGTVFPALVTDTPIDNEAGEPIGVVGVSRDVSERRRAEEHRQLLMHELNHRVKNTLAIVQSLAAQTLRGDRSFGDAREDFDARLMALAGAHGLMTESEWRSVGVDDLIRRTVRPFTDGKDERFEVDGPEISLQPKTAVAFALAIHELCTNAAKYGALSVPAGRVVIRWWLARDPDGPRLRLLWRETGGPRVEAPSRRGFGSRLLERGLAAELQGRVKLDFKPEGLTCKMDVAAPFLDEEETGVLFPAPV